MVNRLFSSSSDNSSTGPGLQSRATWFLVMSLKVESGTLKTLDARQTDIQDKAA